MSDINDVYKHLVQESKSLIDEEQALNNKIEGAKKLLAENKQRKVRIESKKKELEDLLKLITE